jgi:ABC-type transporter Mla MlaB component
MTAFRIGRLDVEITGARAVLAGKLDDTAQLAAVAARLPAGDTAIETSRVTFVNSVGMREWVQLIRTLRGRGTVTLEAVSDRLMVQMNLLAEFRAAALRGEVRIASFHAGYLCPACGHEATPRIDAIAHAAELRALRAPRVACAECGAAMELADFPERYLGVFAADDHDPGASS